MIDPGTRTQFPGEPGAPDELIDIIIRSAQLMVLCVAVMFFEALVPSGQYLLVS